ncbi:MAG: hypothetical protein H6Q89_28 [Myxococcaceae bacterium]|nr:hypothetical protein [Myxococcaceae bacterium]
MRWMNLVIALVAVGLSPMCELAPEPTAATTMRMDYTRGGGFYSAPFPNEDLRKADGSIDLSAFPSRGKATVVDAALAQLSSEARGFSTTAGIFFAGTAPLDPATLPTAAQSLRADASVYLVDVDPLSPSYGRRTPIEVVFQHDGGRFGAPNLLTLIPYQGVPLREATLYAAVITVRVHDQWGRALAVSPAMQTLLARGVPHGLGPPALTEIQGAVEGLRKIAITEELAAIAVFRTGSPLAGMEAMRKALLRELPRPNAPPTPAETFPDFCVYQTTIDMPQYQAGQPPYESSGGSWVFDASGAPVRQRYETAGVLLTLPRRPMPAAGFPTVVFSRTGAGSNRALVEHGTRSAKGEIEPGSGPALEFARAGFAAISIDGPMGGLRNPANADEQFLIFNGSNPAAIRDNIRQSAAELILTARVLEELTVDASGCGGLGLSQARFDTSKLALFGHSMGATIAPLALAFEPRFKAAILSGSGGSWINNLLYKQKPLPVRHITEFMLGYTARFYRVTAGDPGVSLMQWSAEAADPPLYGGKMNTHVLMFQGIVDHYILPPMANASSLSMQLDLAGREVDVESEELNAFARYRDVAAFSGRAVVPYPVAGNRQRPDGQVVTGAVVQRMGDGIQDGHEIVFQTAGPKYQYRCFLATFARGIPQVAGPSDSVEVCPAPP